jgi:formylmethanofuran dehydrogenase subunit A
VKHVDGSTMWLDVNVSETAKVTDDLKRRFKEYWTVEFENYPVANECLRSSNPIPVEAAV